MSKEIWVPPENPSANVQCLIEFMEGINGGPDVAKVTSTLHPDFHIQILPMSLMRPHMDLSQYSEYFSGAANLVKDFKVTIHEVIESERENKIAFHASSTGVARSDGVTPYRNEYILIMHFAQDAEGKSKIIDEKEFVDSLFSSEFFKNERAKLADQQRNS